MLGNAEYCPILFSRVAEIKALRELPAAAKDRLFPVIAARPWPNANQLQRTWDKIAEAIPGQRFGLDLDPFKHQSGSGKAASTDFDAMFNPHDGFRNYFSIFESIPFAVPVLRLSGSTVPQLDRQMEHIAGIERGCILRLQRSHTANAAAIIDAVGDFIGQNFLLILDAGWTKDLLGAEAWFSPIIEQITLHKPEAEVIIAGSSFPDSFSGIGSKGVIPVQERYLFDALVRRHNAANLIYGDWGSTREPNDPAPMKNIARIDLPFDRNWTCFRADTDEEEGYQEVAERALADPSFPNSLQIWGTYMIQCTAEGLPVGIRSPNVAAAARINIHLYRQAYVGAELLPGDADEEFEDVE